METTRDVMAFVVGGADAMVGNTLLTHNDCCRKFSDEPVATTTGARARHLREAMICREVRKLEQNAHACAATGKKRLGVSNYQMTR